MVYNMEIADQEVNPVPIMDCHIQQDRVKQCHSGNHVLLKSHKLLKKIFEISFENVRKFKTISYG